MSGFIPQKNTMPPKAILDFTKHVNYTRGMVLGEDDLLQEFAYLNGRDEWGIRELIGFGTVCGLRVHLESDAQGTKIVIEPGVAVSPQGQLINVPAAQCAYLEAWITATGRRRELADKLGAGAGPGATLVLPLYVVLCYEPCDTDQVPLPGEPCRTEDEVMVASRISDSFQLQLRYTPPEQREEDAVRAFVAGLRQFEVTSGAGAISLPDFITAVRTLLNNPPPTITAKIPAAQLDEYLRAAFIIWTTELRPQWLETAQTCAMPPNEECVLLAQVNVSLVWDVATTSWALVTPVNAGVDESHRPYLLHLRMIQELIREGAFKSTALNGDAVGAPDLNVVKALQNIPVLPSKAAPPTNKQVLTYDDVGEQWIAADPPAGGGAAITLIGDANGAPELNTVSALQNIPVVPTQKLPPSDRQVLTYDKDSQKWIAADPPAGGGAVITLIGDANGAPELNTVNALQNIPVVPTKAAPPTNQQVLTYDAAGGRWIAADPPTAPVLTDIVRHTAGTFNIVAAGIVKGDGSSRRPNYNKLVAQASGADGIVQVTFTDYKQPNTKFSYLVKALPVAPGDNAPSYVANFGVFDKDFFTLVIQRLTGSTIKADELKRVELMIEISQYTA